MSEESESKEIQPTADFTPMPFNVPFQQAIKIANELTDAIAAIEKKGHQLVIVTKGKKYPLVECLTMMGDLLALFPFTEWTRKEGKWKDGDCIYHSRILVRTADGKVICGAEGLCSQEETMNGKSRWGNEFEVLSMAQTRTTGKAYRLSLGWILKLAGIEATPYEEMESVIARSAPSRKEAAPVHKNMAPAPPPGYEAVSGDDDYPTLSAEAMADVMTTPVTDPDNGKTLLGEDVRREFIWTAALKIKGGDKDGACELIREWGSFKGDSGIVRGPLPWETKKDGSLKMQTKWLNLIFDTAKGEWSQYEE